MNTSPIYYDPQRALTEDWKTFFFDNSDTMFTLPCIEGEVTLNGRWCLLNIMITMPLIVRRRLISRDNHMMLEGIYTKDKHAELLTNIARTLERFGYTREDIGPDILRSKTEAHNICYSHLGEYIGTVDIFALAETVLQDDIKEMVTIDYGDTDDKGIVRMENIYKETTGHVVKVMSGNDVENNIFRLSLQTGALKAMQFSQFLVSVGPRTDSDETMILRPVVGSFLSGMTGVLDLVIESRAAAKSTHYNKNRMSGAQYFNRRNHLLVSSQWHLYPGDCGSQVYMTYRPNAKTVKYYLGKFFVDRDGQLAEITPERYDDIIEREILVRGLQGCRHIEGYCETCGGTLTKSFPKDGDMGFIANVKGGSPIAQSVLSQKHQSTTNVVMYEIPEALQGILHIVDSNIYVRPSFHETIRTMAFGFSHKDVDNLNSLRYYNDDLEFDSARFSDIKTIALGRVDEAGNIARLKKDSRVSMKGAANTYPHLSPAILELIRSQKGNMVLHDKLAWLVFKNVDLSRPIMSCTLISNSVRNFIDRFSELITKDLTEYTSMNDFMAHLAPLMWERIGVHITHIECLARACLVTSKKDFHVPIMTDPDNVRFGARGNIIPKRSIGAYLAYEAFDTGSNNPINYLTPKRHSIFDEYLGYSDIIARDMFYPPHTDRVEIEPLNDL